MKRITKSIPNNSFRFINFIPLRLAKITQRPDLFDFLWVESLELKRVLKPSFKAVIFGYFWFLLVLLRAGNLHVREGSGEVVPLLYLV